MRPRSLLLALSACGPTTAMTTSGGTDTTSTTNTSTTSDTSTPSDTTNASPTSGEPVTTTAPASTDSTGDATTFMFIMAPDHPDSWCDLFAQDCPPGQKCSFFSDEDSFNGNVEQRCVPLVADPAQPDDLCHFNEPGIGLDDCEIGSFCTPHNSDGAGTSSCASLCGGGDLDHPTCAEEHICGTLGNGTFWCEFNCNPLVQDCHEGLTCFLGQCHPLSPGSFEQPPGAPCESHKACVPGSACVPESFVPACDDTHCCTELCDLQTPAACTLPGQSCQPAPEDESLDLFFTDNIGLCLLS